MVPRIEIPEGSRCISLVGGGGKTTLIIRLAVQLAEEGKRVAVITTTHMMDPERPAEARQYPADLHYILEENAEAVRAILDEGFPVLIGLRREGRHRSIGSVSDEFYRTLLTMTDVLLIEADGSRRKPVKVPKPWEPVIPAETDVTMAVIGLGALGHALREVCFNPDHVASFLGKEETDILTEEDFAEILSRDMGLRKSCRGEYIAILNQADNRGRQEQGERIAVMLQMRGIRSQILSRREKVALILTASGSGSRFGGNKLLVELEDAQPMFMHAVRLAESVEDPMIERRILVTSHPEIADTVEKRPGWQVVRNDQPEEGIAGSVRRGVEKADDCDAYLFSVCDQPGLKKETVEEILKVWQQGTEGIVSAMAGGRPANPKLFTAAYRDELLRLRGDRGGSVIAKDHPQDVKYVEVEECEIRDVDTREQLELYLRDTQ